MASNVLQYLCGFPQYMFYNLTLFIDEQIIFMNTVTFDLTCLRKKEEITIYCLFTCKRLLEENKKIRLAS